MINPKKHILPEAMLKNCEVFYSGHGVTIYQAGEWRFARSEAYNYDYNTVDGFFRRWGATLDEDPTFAPLNEILDIEVTTICNGPANRLCSFCYKNNNPNGYNMPLADFQAVIDKMPWLTQCALGADAQGTTNPDLIPMMQYARSKGIIPNLTIADVSEEVAEQLASVAGAVAVSVYRHAGYDVAYDSVKRLTDAGMTQVNLHFMISQRTLEDAYEVCRAIKEDPRLANVNAVVFLSLKQKGRGQRHEYVTETEYKELVDHCLAEGIPFGFDSCSAPIFLGAVREHPSYDRFREMAEDCESTLFSSYINEHGHFFPCSFTEKWVEGGWLEGIDVLAADDFVTDVWNHQRTCDFKDVLRDNTDDLGCRQCPAYDVCGRPTRVYDSEVEIVDLTSYKR
jgi:radical SAM protein with 4Fe4S-binding SPASM domain